MPPGSLTIVGTGIKFLSHTPVELRSHIDQAERVLFALADPASARWILDLNANAEPFLFYIEGKPRSATYEAWVEQMLAPVREGFRVCAVFYGHAGVCVYATHEAVRRARQEGFRAQMLPSISAADCLYADLGVDPARSGCQSFDATDFLIHRRRFDPSSGLMLWQVGIVGERVYDGGGPNLRGLRVLVEVLEAHYGPDHEVVIYEAARYAIFEPVIQRVSLSGLLKAEVTEFSILYVPPRPSPPPDPDMLDRLGLAQAQP